MIAVRNINNGTSGKWIKMTVIVNQQEQEQQQQRKLCTDWLRVAQLNSTRQSLSVVLISAINEDPPQLVPSMANILCFQNVICIYGMPTSVNGGNLISISCHDLPFPNLPFQSNSWIVLQLNSHMGLPYKSSSFSLHLPRSLSLPSSLWLVEFFSHPTPTQRFHSYVYRTGGILFFCGRVVVHNLNCWWSFLSAIHTRSG